MSNRLSRLNKIFKQNVKSYLQFIALLKMPRAMIGNSSKQPSTNNLFMAILRHYLKKAISSNQNDVMKNKRD